jgi:hypothetical protein
MAVPVKRTRKPAPPVKYLLSGDRKLQRLSLKKISDPANKAKPKARSTRVKQATGGQTASTAPKGIGWRGAVVGVVCLFAAAALLAARQPAADPEQVSAGGPPQVSMPAQAQRLTVDRDADTNATSASMRSLTPGVARPHTTSSAIERAPAAAPAKKTETAKAAVTTAASSSTAPVQSSSSLTVEGCLESDGPTYRLKNTSGLDAPKARTWRTGFLMKRSPSIGLVDTTGRLNLQDHIGTRVAATGSLVDREFRATALREVAASCRPH